MQYHRAQPKSTTPAVSSDESENILEMAYPMKGIKAYCRIVPIKTALGLLKTSKKSSRASVIPIPTSQAPAEKELHLMGRKISGDKRAIAERMIAHKGNKEVNFCNIKHLQC
jgi:hypothetical protein